MPADVTVLLRRMLLALLVFGVLAVIAELVFLEHTESGTQLLPLVTLACGFVAAAAVAVRTRRSTLLALRVVMLAFIGTGLLGLALHYRGNVEFELERNPRLGGFALFREAIHGATPALAPGALIQLGLLGLIYTWRHPQLRNP